MLLGAVAGALPASITVDVRGELASEEVTVLQLAALRGVFSAVVEDQVTFVNAPAMAEERGVGVELTKASESPNHRSVVTLRAALADGSAATVAGTLSGPQQVQKVVEINGRHFDLRAQGTTLLLSYMDRPGVMGRVGTMLGESEVNIEAAQISQAADGKGAMMLLRVDRPVAENVLEPIGAAVGASTIQLVDLS